MRHRSHTDGSTWDKKRQREQRRFASAISAPTLPAKGQADKDKDKGGEKKKKGAGWLQSFKLAISAQKDKTGRNSPH